MNSAVTYHQQDFVGQIIMRRGRARNSMTAELLDAFKSACGEAIADRTARCIVVSGEGPCFSAGADLSDQVQAEDPASMPHERSLKIYQPFLSVLDIKVPVIAAMNGHAVGGGFGMALACDIRLAHSTSKYGVNFTRLGITPGMGLSETLRALVGESKAAELFFTGRLISGEHAERIGLASAAYDDDVIGKALEMAKTIASNAPIALRMTKQLTCSNRAERIRHAAYLEALVQAPVLATDDAREGMSALLGKREPDFKGIPTKN